MRQHIEHGEQASDAKLGIPHSGRPPEQQLSAADCWGSSDVTCLLCWAVLGHLCVDDQGWCVFLHSAVLGRLHHPCRCLLAHETVFRAGVQSEGAASLGDSLLGIGSALGSSIRHFRICEHIDVSG